MFVKRYDTPVSSTSPNITAGLATLAIGVGVYWLATKTGKKQKKEVDAGTMSATQLTSVTMTFINQQMRKIKNTCVLDSFCPNTSIREICDWAKAQHIPMNKNSIAKKIYTDIMIVSAIMMIVACKKDWGYMIPDYFRGKGLFSPLALVFDLISWDIAFATIPPLIFREPEDKLSEADIKTLEKIAEEMSGFKDAIVYDFRSGETDENGNSASISWLKNNEINWVSPLAKLKEFVEQNNIKTMFNEITESEQKWLGDIPTNMIHTFEEKLSRILEEPLKVYQAAHNDDDIDLGKAAADIKNYAASAKAAFNILCG